MTTTDFIAELNQYKPSLPPLSILDTVKYIHNGLNEWGESDDVNSDFRAAVTESLFGFYTQEHKEIIRFLLSAEIQNCREETMMTDTLRRLTFMLYDLGDIADIPLLFEAKWGTSFDATCSLDAELIIGKEPEKVKEYYSNHPHPLYNIIECIEQENNNCEPPKLFIEQMRKRYAH